MEDKEPREKNIDENFRERLLQESRNPFRGVRRLLWLAFFGSGFIGLFVMAFRQTAGQVVELDDLGIQFAAVFIFGFLLWFDRKKTN